MNRKSILAILTCLLMISSFAAGLLPVIVQAEPDLITMWGVRTSDPFWGYYGGYHDMWAVIKPELLKIGIDLRIETFDAFTFEAIWYDDWEISGDPNNDGIRDGWDLSMREWWLNPTSHIWLDEMVLADKVPEWNVNPWMDEKADLLYNLALASVGDSERFKRFMWLWQEEFMHNPPFIANYYADVMTARAAYFDGYDETSWVYGLREFRINQTVFDAVAPGARKAVGSDTLIWGAAEAMTEIHPFATSYYTEEAVNVLKFGMLYRNEREHMNFTADPKDRGAFRVHPDLAADYLTWYDDSEALGYDPGFWVARMPIRQGIYWSDGEPFDATDVAWSINIMLDGGAGTGARMNYIDTIKEAVAYNATTVDLICYVPRYELAGLFAHGWGWSMLPKHQYVAWGLEDDLGAWMGHVSNSDPIPESQGGEGLEVLGPYVPVASDFPAMTFMEFERFDVATGYPWYWDNQTMPDDTDNPGKSWGWALPEKFIIKIIPDAADRLIGLQTLAIDFAEYPTAPIETYEAMEDWPTHRVYTYEYPASNPLWFNLNNPILSNRYVRLAIAHAIPYPKIFNEILPGWGVAKVYPGKTYIWPGMEAFNTELPPYEYNIAKAQMYMDMWRKSQAGSENYPVNDNPLLAQGPVGDADFSGLVDLDDLFVWRDRYLYGPAPSTYTQYEYPYDTATFPDIPIADLNNGKYWPGNNVDADFDNDDDITFATSPNPWVSGDWEFWSLSRGTTYPFPGAR